MKSQFIGDGTKMVNFVQLVLVFLCHNAVYGAEFMVPEVRLEAFQPSGFRASIPDVDGIRFFAVHASINHNISNAEPGDIYGTANKAINGLWFYYDPKIKLKLGDILNYWVFVQHKSLGYRKVGQEWVVTQTGRYTEMTDKCEQSVTIVGGQRVACKDRVIFSDDFDDIDNGKWFFEHKIPTYSQQEKDSKFNSYQNIDETRFVSGSKLFLKPWIVSEEETRGELDLTNGCTGTTRVECSHVQKSSFLLPPVKSARIGSKFNFKYGRIDIEAKLPAGDWIFPEIQLIPTVREERDSHKIWLAYARGNANYVGNAGDNIGANLLFAGPIVDNQEPIRSKYLKTASASHPFFQESHVFTFIWQPGSMRFLVDNQEFGDINTQTELNYTSTDRGLKDGALFDGEFLISLGVGVGGIVDFPDGYTSSGRSKPWSNGERNLIKKFFDSRRDWSQTWIGDNVALQINSIKVTSV